MLRAVALFDDNIASARHLANLYAYLTTKVAGPIPFEDILRSQIVYSVSAFDKLMHDLIRIGIMEVYNGIRSPTPRYHREQITMEVHGQLVAASIPPKEILFEQEIVRKLSYLSFQDPDRLAEGLSLIWDEASKWDKIAARMGTTASVARTRLKLIVGRRNAIVHEADMHPITNIKTPLAATECSDITDFIHECGRAVVVLVR
jgi:hypothetical protein